MSCDRVTRGSAFTMVLAHHAPRSLPGTKSTITCPLIHARTHAYLRVALLEQHGLRPCVLLELVSHLLLFRQQRIRHRPLRAKHGRAAISLYPCHTQIGECALELTCDFLFLILK